MSRALGLQTIGYPVRRGIGRVQKLYKAALFAAASSQNLSIASNALLQSGAVDFWIAGWYKPASAPAEMGMVSKADGGTGEYLIDIVSGTPRLYSNGSNVAWGSAPTLSQWHHVFAWRDQTAGTINLSVDNGAAVSLAVAAPAATTVPFRIGAYGTTASAFFDGAIDSVAWGKSPAGGIAGVLSAMRASLWNGGLGKAFVDLTASEKSAWGLVSWWDLDEASGTRLDAYGTNHLTSNNNVGQTQGIA